MLRFLFITVVTVFLLLHNLPYLLRDQVVGWLLDNGAEHAELTAIKVDWFEGKVLIDGLKASAENKPPLIVDTVKVDLDYSQLLEKKVLLTRVELAGIDIGLREEGQHLWLGALDLNTLNKASEIESREVEEPPSTWGFGLAELRLDHVKWKTDIAGQKHLLQLHSGRLADFYLWDQDQLVSIDLDGALNEAPISLSSSSLPLHEEKSSELNIKLDNFPLHSVTAVFLPTLRAYVDLDLSIKVTSDFNSEETHLMQSGFVNIRGLAFEQEGLNVKKQRLTWNGTLNIALLKNELKSLITKGRLNVEGVVVNQVDSQIKLGGLQLDSAINLQELTQLQIANLALDIKKLDLSHSEQAVGIDALYLKAPQLESVINLQDLTHLNVSDVTLDIDHLNISQAQQTVEIDVFRLKTSEVDTAVGLQGLQQLNVAGLLLDANALQLSQDQQTAMVDTIHLNADAETPDMNVWDASVPTVTLSGVSLSSADTMVSFDELALSSGALKHKNNGTSVKQGMYLSVPSLSLDNIGLSAAGDSLVSLKHLMLKSVTLEDVDNIALAEIKTEQLKVAGDGGVFTQWDGIHAKSLHLDELNTLSIDQLLLNDSKTRLHLTPQRSLSDLDWLLKHLPAPEEKGEVSLDKSVDSDNPAFRVKLNQVLLSGNNQVSIVDQGVKPAFKTKLDINKIDLRSLDTGSKGETSFELAAKSKFSTITAKGAMELFSGNYGGHWDAVIKGLELPEVSPYSLEYTGYYLQSGQLTLTTKGSIQDRKLDGDSDIRLNKLEVEARNNKRSGEFDKKVSMPLGTAIMILQDNDNNIDLQIPLDGSLDDPKFGYQTVINKLAGKGLKSAAMGYLTKALQPFGALISISQMVMDAQEKGSFIKLQPVFFAPAQTTLSSESKQYMAKLAEMMNERKGMRMNICGLAVIADKPAIWEQLLEANEKRDEPVDEEILSLELEPALQALAQERSDAVKSELSDKQGVDIERLFSCYPKVDLKTEEKPQVTLGL